MTEEKKPRSTRPGGTRSDKCSRAMHLLLPSPEVHSAAELHMERVKIIHARGARAEEENTGTPLLTSRLLSAPQNSRFRLLLSFNCIYFSTLK